MRSPKAEEFDHLVDEVKRVGDMLTQLIELVGTLVVEMRDGLRKQEAEMQPLRTETHSIRDELRAEFRAEIGQAKTELKVEIEALRHDIRSERRARGHWQAETEYRISSLELRLEGEPNV